MTQLPNTKKLMGIELFNKVFRKLFGLLRLILRPFSEEILVIGDSHASVFEYWKFITIFPRKYFNVCSVAGATISGIENPNSKTKSLPIYMKALEKKCSKIIIMLGEVDTGFIIWYQAEKYQASVLAMTKMTFDRYTIFLDKVKKINENTIVISTPLPTIEDRNDWGEVANLRREVKASQLERTKLTLLFNKLIKEYCDLYKIKFIDLDSKCLGDDGLLKEEFMNKNKFDHHYDKDNYFKLLSEQLRTVL